MYNIILLNSKLNIIDQNSVVKEYKSAFIPVKDDLIYITPTSLFTVEKRLLSLINNNIVLYGYLTQL
jgi:hypothetical protein